ncbi:MAG: L,D-transpeptidase family protein [Bacteroidota bacterium]
MKITCMTLLLATVINLVNAQQASFKDAQLKYERVKTAYREKETEVHSFLSKAGISKSDAFTIFLRAFKYEKKLELWAKKKTADTFALVKTFEICSSSGELGPKRREGDYQVPEGFYNIFHFNPVSNFYLSLGVSYPNASDRKLGKVPLGGSIYIHGNCVTIGCIPIEDEFIKELYVACVEARHHGQAEIQVHIFPAHLDDTNFTYIKSLPSTNEALINFWGNLKTGYEYFEKNHTLPHVSVDAKGKYLFR